MAPKESIHFAEPSTQNRRGPDEKLSIWLRRKCILSLWWNLNDFPSMINFIPFHVTDTFSGSEREKLITVVVWKGHAQLLLLKDVCSYDLHSEKKSWLTKESSFFSHNVIKTYFNFKNNQHGTTLAVTSTAQWADCFWGCLVISDEFEGRNYRSKVKVSILPLTSDKMITCQSHSAIYQFRCRNSI